MVSQKERVPDRSRMTPPSVVCVCVFVCLDLEHDGCSCIPLTIRRSARWAAAARRECVNLVAYIDYPAKWPELLPALALNIQVGGSCEAHTDRARDALPSYDACRIRSRMTTPPESTRRGWWRDAHGAPTSPSVPTVVTALVRSDSSGVLSVPFHLRATIDTYK